MENEQIQNEISVMRQLHHPNIVEIIEVIERATYTNESAETYGFPNAGTRPIAW